jgi:hypothetical protein
LRIEEPNPEFQTSIQQISTHRNKWLTRRQDIRSKASLLYSCAKGEALTFPTVDPEATSDEQPDPDPFDPTDPQLNIAEEDYGVSRRMAATGISAGATLNLVVGIFEQLRDQLAASPPFGQPYSAPLASASVDLIQRVKTITSRLTFDANAELLTMVGPLDPMLYVKLTLVANPETDKDFLTALEKISTDSANNDLFKINSLGLEKFIQFLDTKVQPANDKVDLGFIRAQTDIYRLRQIVLENTIASRLATSPTLATIAQGESAMATREDIQKFYDRFKDTTPPSTATKDGTTHTLMGATATTGENTASAKVVAAGSTGTFKAALSKGLLSSVEGSFQSKLESQLGGTESAAELAEFRASATGINFIPPAKQVSTDDIVGQSPVVGASNLRTLTIAERLTAPKAPEAKLFTVATKHDVIKSMLDTGIYLDDIPIPGIAEKDQFDDAGQPKRKNDILLGDIKDNLGQILSEPSPQHEDESAYFVGAVDLLDHTVAVLHSIEARIEQYRQAIAACQKVLDQVRDFFRQANQRLQTINDELAESRHDFAVANTLLADEVARVNGINDRRDQVLQQVKFLAFQRPRLSELRLDTVTRVLDPDNADPAVPGCLNRSETPPDNLRAMVDLFRHVPVRWITHVLPFLRELSTIHMLTSTLLSANRRATSQVAEATDPVAQVVPSLAIMSLFAGTTPRQSTGDAIQNVYSAQQKIIMQTRTQAAQFDAAQVNGLSWQRMHDLAADRVSLGDLIDGAHNRLDVSQNVSSELDRILHVATCLYEGFDGILPILRLTWTELLSQYDSPVHLRNLANLPRWSEVPFLQRRSMQELADWLYNRVDLSQPQAVALMNDLVRICILTASHAPVNAIIAGDIPRPTRATVGERIDLRTLEVSKVRIGMQALVFRQNQVVAQGVVEDLSEGQVAARILAVQASASNGHPAESISLEAGTQVHFVEKIYQTAKFF